MKHIRHLALCLLLALSLATSALAAEIPDDLVVENLNGQQRMVKTYVLSPDIDPETLKEPSFDYDGFTYTWAYTTKVEQPYLDTKTVSQIVTVETSSKELSDILDALAPSISYDDGEYAGALALDHTTLSTEASGYTTKYGSVTETKVIGPLDRNDMSYVPATTVKNGRTLSLSHVDWQVIGTALVGEALVPSQYQAVATYSASTSWKAATGYVTTAEYHGEVVSEGIESITYTVVYTGEEIAAEVTHAVSGLSLSGFPWAAVGAAAGLLLLAGLGACLFLRRRNVCVYVPGDRPRDYKLVAKFHVSPETPEIDISGEAITPGGIVAVEVKRSLVKKLLGQTFTVRHAAGTHTYEIIQDSHDDWHEFNLEEEPLCGKD